MSTESSKQTIMYANKSEKNNNRNTSTSSSEGSNRLQNSQESKSSSQGSTESNPQHEFKLLQAPRYKSSVTVDIYQNEESLKGTGTTLDSTAPTVITAVLRDLRDDIVHSSSYQQSVAVANSDKAIAIIGGDNVYVQNKNKFMLVPREKALSTPQDQLWPYHANRFDEHSSLDIALLLQKVFSPLSSICCGLLGGVALLQLTLVYYLNKGVIDEDWDNFLESYSRFAELAPLLFYILLAVCVVSVLDRAQIQQGNIIFHQSWLLVLVYGATLVLTLSTASNDTIFAHYLHNKTQFHKEMKIDEFMSEWQLFNTLRCFFAIFGWILFSLISPPDLLYKELLEIKDYEGRKQLSPSLSGNLLHQ